MKEDFEVIAKLSLEEIYILAHRFGPQIYETWKAALAEDAYQRLKAKQGGAGPKA